MTVEADELAGGSRRKGGRPSAMTDEMQARVKPLLEAGVRVQEIAREVGLDISTIYKYRASLLAAKPAGAKGASTT
jgi:hypothetical protein